MNSIVSALLNTAGRGLYPFNLGTFRLIHCFSRITS
jgi:hypothetical protein